MEHPFELQISDLQAIDFDLTDLDDTATTQVVGGSATITGSPEAGGTCFMCEYPQTRKYQRYPRRYSRRLPLAPVSKPPVSTGRFASQEAMDAYINSPDYQPDMLALI